MSNRYVATGRRLRREKYLSSPELLNGISGMAVAERCTLLTSPTKRELLWFIQGLSLLPGGVNRLSSELLEMFPERCETFSMQQLGKGKGAEKTYNPKEAAQIRAEIYATAESELLAREFQAGDSEPQDHWADALPVAPPLGPQPSVSWQILSTECRREAGRRLAAFLTELCISSDLTFRASGEMDSVESEHKLIAERFGAHSITFAAELSCFDDIVGALFEFKRRYEERVKAEFCQTAISRRIWKQLDDVLKTRTMGVIDGREGRGKTETVRAWCNCHLGLARFVSLDGTSTKTTQFRELARALGVGHGYLSKAVAMQAEVKDVAQASGLMLVIDEAHFFFNQGPRMHTRPEMLDWIDTALCNPPLPVALVTTPQFMVCMERAANQVGWNYRQFKRRCKRYCRLPEKNTPEDIEAVARHLLPGADKATIKQIVAYEALSKRDLSAVGDVVREAKLLAEETGAAKIGFEHVKRAIFEVLLASDLPWAEMEKRLRNSKSGRLSVHSTALLAPEPAQEERQEAEPEATPRKGPSAPSGARARFSERIEAPAVATD